MVFGVDNQSDAVTTDVFATADPEVTSSFSRGRITRSDGESMSAHPAHAPRWLYVYNLLLLVFDALMMLTACGIVLFLRPDILMTVTASIPGGLWSTLAVFVGTWIVCLAATQTYHHHTMGEGYGLYAKILTATVSELVVLCSAGFILSLNFPRGLVVFAPLIVCALTVVERWLMRRALHHNRRKGQCNYRTVMVGSPEGILKAVDALGTTMGKSIGYAPIAVCPVARTGVESDPDAPQHLVSVPDEFSEAVRKAGKSGDVVAGLPVLKLNTYLPQMARRMGARVVFITDVLTRDSETMRTLSLAVESLGMELAVTAEVADMGSGRLVMRSNSAMPILSATLPQYSPLIKFVKRAIDIVVSFVALIPGSLLILCAAVAIKLEDGGPVFYKQERIGLMGKPFQCYKVRSMRVDADKMDKKLAEQMGAEHGILFKPKNDPRITRVGKFIRKTSIDELPQLFNVLKGDMSLVGPRPQQRYEVEQYGPLYSTRLLVRPGITGPWQISGRSNLSKEEAEFLDVNYVERWSLMTDIAILIKTVAVVFNGDGAY